MQMADAPLPPTARQVSAESAQSLQATRNLAIATLAGAIITSAGRPHSVKDAMRVFDDVRFAMFPMPGQSRYEKWKADPKGLASVHK